MFYNFKVRFSTKKTLDHTRGKNEVIDYIADINQTIGLDYWIHNYADSFKT